MVKLDNCKLYTWECVNNAKLIRSEADRYLQGMYEGFVFQMCDNGVVNGGTKGWWLAVRTSWLPITASSTTIIDDTALTNRHPNIASSAPKLRYVFTLTHV